MTVKKVFLVKERNFYYKIVSETGFTIFSFYAKFDDQAKAIAENYMSSFISLAIIEFKQKESK